MKTQLEQACEGILTQQMARVAETEGLHPDRVRQGMAKGEIVIPCNPNRPAQKVVGFGRGLRTKVNASIGTSSDIGASQSARHGADLVCYITPAEHLALPTEADVREGVRVTRLAVRVGDIAKYPERRENEKQAAMARRDMRWEDLDNHLLFPELARKVREERKSSEKETCSMCGDFCAMKKGMEVFETDISPDKMA